MSMSALVLVVLIAGAQPVVMRSGQQFEDMQACETQRKSEAGFRRALRAELTARYNRPVQIVSRCVTVAQGVAA